MTTLRFAFRTLFKTPFVTTVAVVSLALGIGANAAIFSLFDQILLQPLAVPEANRLVNLGAPGPKPGSTSCNQAGDCDQVFSYAMFRDIEKAQTVFTGVAAHVSFGANLAADNQTENGQGLLVSGSYFPVIGLSPAIGRLLTPDDDKTPGESHVVVLSHAYWQRRFGLDPNLVGKTITVNGQAMTVVGVAARGFDGTTLGVKPLVFAPITMRGFSQPFKGFDNRSSYWTYLFARLKPGVTIEQAKASLAGPYHNILNDVEAPLQKNMSAQTMTRFKAKTLTIEPGANGQSNVHTGAKAPLTLLLGVTAFVLLIACANIANLLLARSAARAGEMALLVAAGLFVRSLLNVSKTDLGLKADNVIMFSLSPALNGYTSEKSLAFFERVEDALAVLPGVAGVTAGTVPLLAGNNWGNNVAVDGFEAGPDTDTNSRFNLIGPQYFHTLGMSMIAGREFTRGDGLAQPRVAVVNEAFAKKFNLGRDAVGKHMSDQGFDGKKDIEIVGLVQNAKYSDVKREIPPQFFRSYRQDKNAGFITFYVRTAADPVPFMTNIPKAIAQLDAQLPVENLRTLPEQVRQNVFLDRFISVLSTAFACLATLLAAVGLYGVLAYTVSQRTREFGVRMALGAAPGRVRGMVMRQVGVMTIVGGVIGLAGAIGLGKLSESLLYQLKGSDPLVLAGAAAALAIVALGAGFIPAHRASQVEPMRALRYE